MSPKLLMLLIGLCYAIACGLPALDFGPRRHHLISMMSGTVRGIECLLQMPIVLFHAPWWANVFLAAGLVAVGNGSRKTAIWCGIVAVLLAASTFVMSAKPLEGCYLWQACMIGLLLLAFLVPVASEPTKEDRSGDAA